MNQKFVIKCPELSGYFNSITSTEGVLDVAITDEKHEAKTFDLFLEAKEWLKKATSKDMNYTKITQPPWEIVLINMKNGSNDFDEVMTWYSTTEM